MGRSWPFLYRVGLPGQPAPTHYAEPYMRSPIRAWKLLYLALRSAAEPTLFGVSDLDRIIRLKYSMQL